MSTSNGQVIGYQKAPPPPDALRDTAMLTKRVAELLGAVPDEWRGTTFDNSALIGRGEFSARLMALLADANVPVTHDRLEALGNAEDYLRVATNISTTLETVLAVAAGHGDVARVFSFSSIVMPLLAVALTAVVVDTATMRRRRVVVYTGAECAEPPAPLTADAMRVLGLLGAQLEFRAGDAPARDGDVPDSYESTDDLVVAWHAAPTAANVDAVVAPYGILYVQRPLRIRPADVLLVRKRMSTPATTPSVEAALRRFAGVPATAADSHDASADERAAVRAHLQTLCGTDEAADAPPALFTAGLPTIHAIWLALIGRGGVDVLMCSTAYGGSSQLSDLTAERAPLFAKHTFDIQGERDLAGSVCEALDRLAERGDALLPTTVLFLEMPTNPDMKMIEARRVADALNSYAARTKRHAVLLVDTTFAPGSKTLERVRAAAPDLPAMAFISLSKSLSRGRTTGGTVVANHTPFAVDVVRAVAAIGSALDTAAKPEQWASLAANHVGVEERCATAYSNAVRGGDALRAAVAATRDGYDMRLAFVSPADAALGYHTSTFSFNLPVPRDPTPAAVDALPQRFVDLLTADAARFKPCVSFGQDNGLVYCTVPATSTQGAIADEHKAKQAANGVQLVRLSFPPTIDMDAVCAHIADCVTKLYA
eukprot:TRINITY_DN298_c0_g1_i1.p2 TRINITY_DN298_c0_g1~~TRINITY_DN298_c0_g1_i1.p2  ORF type:complete len:655 (-),score=470.01 TRINITY_DN298_c0_g1_i1:126-2090(-)